jgi:hypothetical protein
MLLLRWKCTPQLQKSSTPSAALAQGEAKINRIGERRRAAGRL